MAPVEKADRTDALDGLVRPAQTSGLAAYAEGLRARLASLASSG